MSAIFTEDRESPRLTPAATLGPAAARLAGDDLYARWIMLFLVVGVAGRLIRYFLRFPLWGDEAMLAMNFLDRGYADMLRPLNFHQVAPLLFLWIEHTAVNLLGFNEWSLRLFPLACSLASLFLFHRLAKYLLRGPALLLAVGIFSVSYSGFRYAAEVKPYAVDLMVSTLLLLLAVRWWRQPGDVRWLWTLAAVVPLALGLSYPAIFVAGGVSLAVATVLAGRPARENWRGWWAWGAYNLALVGGFLAWYRLSVGAQAGAELEVMGRMWTDTFPPRDSLGGLAAWLLRVHTGALLAVPVGGDNWGSIGTALFCIVAAFVLFRRRHYRLIVLCAAPLALNLLAAALRRFPYGGHMRLAMHLAPLVSILAGIGVAAIFHWLGRDVRNRHARNWPLAAAVAMLFLLAALSTARDFYHPGKEQQEIRKRDFAVWFWGSMEREHEVVSIEADLHENFAPPGVTWENCVSPQFLCNQRIYSPRAIRGEPADLSRVSRERPLACVQYWTHLAPYDQAAFDRWLNAMNERYDLASTQRLPMLQDNDDDRLREPSDRVEVYEFVPKVR